MAGLTRADVLRPDEAAELLRIPRSTLYDLARRGVIPCSRLGRTMRFVRPELERCLREGFPEPETAER